MCDYVTMHLFLNCNDYDNYIIVLEIENDIIIISLAHDIRSKSKKCEMPPILVALSVSELRGYSGR